MLSAEPFSNDWYTGWGFWLSLFSLLIGAVGLGITYWQVKRTLRAAEAAKDAAEQTEKQSVVSFRKFAAWILARQLAELEQSYNQEKWELASSRAEDIAILLAQLVPGSSLPTQFRNFSADFLKKTRQPNARIIRKDWLALMQSTKSTLDNLNAPFKILGDIKP
jgi:hypothetical protein